MVNCKKSDFCTFFRKIYEHFYRHQILSRRLVIWNHEGHVVALEGKSHWKFVEQFRVNLRTYWRNHGYLNVPLFLCVSCWTPIFDTGSTSGFTQNCILQILNYQENGFFYLEYISQILSRNYWQFFRFSELLLKVKYWINTFSNKTGSTSGIENRASSWHALWIDGHLDSYYNVN